MLKRIIQVSVAVIVVVAGIYSLSVFVRVGFPSSFDRIPGWIIAISDQFDKDFGIPTNPDAPPPRRPTTETSTPSLADRVEVGQYTVRPPQGYQTVNPPTHLPPQIRKFVWAGDLKDNNTRGMFTVLLIPLSPEDKGKNVIKDHLASMWAEQRERMDDWKQTDPVRVQVNGMEFLHVRWSGFDKSRDRQRYGFHFMAQDGNTVICIGSVDNESHSGEGLKLAEAAALTFRKK